MIISNDNQKTAEHHHYKSVRLLGVRINILPAEDLIEAITQSILSGEKAIITNVNIHAMNLAYEQSWFREFLNHSKITFCDGYGVILGARLKGVHIPFRYTPPDWIPLLCQSCVDHDFSLYILGAKPGVAERTANQLQAKYPKLRIVGMRHGYFDKNPSSRENHAVICSINDSNPNILIVGFGMPLQENWLMNNWQDIHAQIAIPVGAAIDYLSGEIPRAPSWMTNHGLEWIGRLIYEPRRLWRRYLLGNPLFFWRLISD